MSCKDRSLWDTQKTGRTVFTPDGEEVCEREESLSISFRPDAPQILDRLRREGIVELCHFTSIENLPLIQRLNALCSKQALEEAGVWPDCDPGGNALSHNLDRCNDNWGRVPLHFTPRTPMSYRKKREKHLCFFKLNPVVATIAGVLLSPAWKTPSLCG
jgi:hypothetical protein